ncbi:MAG: lipoyl synthase [Lentisphaeria bacterium]|jgi:lipoic acid synthetase|nr:lipoyl synthase [Lentisphaeria bacterium]
MPNPKAERLPEWLKVSLDGAKPRNEVRRLLRSLKLHTVCEGARCPNLCECWQRKAATFLVLGDTCTRNCRFCAVNHGRPQPVDPEEPARVAEAVRRLGLRFVVVTCVTRDDLPDGGAAHLAATIRAIREMDPTVGVEILPSDFGGDLTAVDTVLAARPDVFNHNLETVARLTPQVRSRATYERSLAVLAHASQQGKPLGIQTKSGLMLGMGETADELRQALADLRQAGVRILTLGQYLPPSPEHWPLDRYLEPAEFAEWGRIAREEYGFAAVVSGPLVRSSYLAEQAARE